MLSVKIMVTCYMACSGISHMDTNIQEEPARFKILDESASSSKVLLPAYPPSRCHTQNTIILTSVITTLPTKVSTSI
jgi:hypothetical protein